MDSQGIILSLLLLPLAAILVDVIGAARSRVPDRAAGIAASASQASFEVLVPIYGHTRYLTNIDFLRSYGHQVILCTPSGGTTEFQRSLQEIADKYGFRIFRSDFVAPSANSQRSTGGTIRDRVIRDALANAVTAEYSVCLDADTASRRSLAELVGELQRRGDDVASIQLVPQAQGPLIVQLQRHEYRLAMRMRSALPWLLSGACHVGRTSALRVIMGQHSMFFQGNDVETGLLGKRLGLRMTHIPFVVDTDVPSTLRDWWRQRTAWSGGEFRLYIVNFRFAFWHPFFWAYGAIILFGFFLFRWAAVLQPGSSLFAAGLLYFIMVYAVHWKTRDRWLLLMPFYTLLTSLVILPLGIASYFAMAVPEGNFGVIRFSRRRPLLHVQAAT